MANERVTENLVRDRLRELGFRDPEKRILVEEQASVIEAVRKALTDRAPGGGVASGLLPS